MKITFKDKYLSIDHFAEVETSDFVVLTGKNGSGKTHLLKAIEQGKVLVNDNSNASQRVVYFDYRSFNLEDEHDYNGEMLNQQRKNAWNSLNAVITNMNNDNYNREKYTRVRSLYRKVSKCVIPFWKLTIEDIKNPQLFQEYVEYKQNFENSLRGYNTAVSAEINKLLEDLPYPITAIKEAEFNKLYQPYELKNDFLPNQIGKVIWDYYIKLRNNELNEFLNKRDGGKREVIPKNEFKELYGEKPWEVMNEILDSFDFTGLRIESPEGTDYFESYHAKLVRKSDGLKIEFSDFSSGEKILMALVASIYKGESDNHFPDVLLLDEIDASLHPSMIKNLLNVIDNVFLSRGVKVILATHSPTTVALSGEESVYLMNKSGENRIEKSSRKDALGVLTEGYMTLEDGIRILDDVNKDATVIITEGYNTIIIDKLLEVYNIKNAVTLKGIESNSGTSLLRSLFQILRIIKHRNKIIFVWDCDFKEADRFSEENNVIPLRILENENNTLATRGIENAFSKTVFQKEFIKTVTVSTDVGENVEKLFNSDKKKEFAEFISENATKENFSQFQPLVDLLQEGKDE